MTARFAPVDLTADVAALPANERQALAKMVEAARVFDALYLRQVWEGNESLLVQLSQDQTPLGRARLDYFLLNKGPWSRLDHNEPFVAGVPAKPPQANFYAAGATKEEVEKWLATLPPAEREQATGFFTTIRRGPDGKLQAVPYSLEYQGELARVAALLREAAALTTQPTLKAYLDTRAAALAEQRLLRQRHRLDGAGRQHRADHRPVRDLRGRVVQLQGGVRGVHHAARRRRDAEAGAGWAPSCRASRTTCRSTPSSGTRSWARWRRSGWSTPCSRRATATAACRPRPSTCPTTSAWSRRRAPSA